MPFWRKGSWARSLSLLLPHCQLAPRPVPVHLQDAFKSELDHIVNSGVISPLQDTDSTPEWMNSFIIVRKPNSKLRVLLRCQANKYVLEETHLLL